MFDSIETGQLNRGPGAAEPDRGVHTSGVPSPVERDPVGAKSIESEQPAPRTRPTDIGECMILTEDLLATDDRVARLAGSRNLVDCNIVDMVADVIFSGEWCISGIHSEHHWVAYKLGITRRQAARLIAVAERRDELPYVFERFDTGSLSLDQMLLIVRHCPTGFDETVAELAVNATIPQLRRIMRAYEFPDPKPNGGEDDGEDGGEDDGEDDGEDGPGSGTSTDSEPEPGHDTPLDQGPPHPDDACPSDTPDGFAPGDLDKPYRGFSFGFDDDGSFRMWLRCGADDGAEIMAALDQARAWLKADTGDIDVSGFESFLAMLRAGVEADPSGSRAADNRVLVHLEASEFAAWAMGLRPNLHLGPVLSSEALELLSCDGSIQVLLNKFGKPVSLGRTSQTVPYWLREIILNRDQSCRFPGCFAQRWLDVHHMKHWIKGGRTDPDNLVTLCRRHHREHHRGAFSIAGNPETEVDCSESHSGLRFVARDGREITRVVPIPEVPPEGHYVHGSGEQFDSALVHIPLNGPPNGRPRTWVPSTNTPVATAPCHPGAP